MNKVLLTLLSITLISAVSAPGVIAQGKKDKKKKNFQATISQTNKPKTVLKDVGIRAGSSLFSSSSGKQELEVKKDGGKLKITVPFEKIAKLRVLKVDRDYVEIEITTPSKAVLKGHIATNVEIFGKYEFGEGKIRIRDAKEIEFKELK
jgi:hypothetical protein